MQFSGLRARLPGAALLAAAATALAGCGGAAEPPAPPTVAPARTFALVGFAPARPVPAGRSERVAFSIRQPDGSTLTSFRTGAGPHTGVHLIVVRDDLSTIIHRHPPVAADGRVAQPITFPEGGRYRVLADIYPDLAGSPLRNFQLTRDVRVAGAAGAQPLPPFAAVQEADGFRFEMTRQPRITSLRPAFLTVIVTDPSGRPARFTPLYGALAHAIFFRQRSLDYFHTHVCAPNAAGCATALGGATVTGTSSRPGVLRVGVLLPQSGVWRLFLQVRANGRVLTAPYTLRVR
jgi:hypothetical protein